MLGEDSLSAHCLSPLSLSLGRYPQFRQYAKFLTQKPWRNSACCSVPNDTRKIFSNSDTAILQWNIHRGWMIKKNEKLKLPKSHKASKCHRSGEIRTCWTSLKQFTWTVWTNTEGSLGIKASLIRRWHVHRLLNTFLQSRKSPLYQDEYATLEFTK